MPRAKRTSRTESSARPGARTSTHQPPPSSASRPRRRTHEQQHNSTTATSSVQRTQQRRDPLTSTRAPPRARPYATTVSPRGRLPGPRSVLDRHACYALTLRASLRSESITFAHCWGVMAPGNRAELWRAGSGRGASGPSQPRGAGRQAGVIYLAPQDRFSLNSLRGRTRTARTGVPRMFHTNPLVAIFR